MKKSLKELSDLVSGKLIGDGDIIITGVGDIETAKKGELTFVKDKTFIEKAKKSNASAVIVPPETKELHIPTIEVKNPYLAFIKILSIIYSEKRTFYYGIHKTAIMGKDVKLGKNVSIGPYCVIGDNVNLGDETIITSNIFIGDNVNIGKNCFIYPNVSIREDTIIGDNVTIHCGTVIGSDGYGYLPDGEKYIKIPQVGKVIIENDVEIGANVSIDRATAGATLIKSGTKIDNLVHIAHNVTIGENSLLLGQVGIAGSTKIGKHAILAGQTGAINGLKIGDNVTAGARTGILQDVPDNSVIWGMPAIPLKEQKKLTVLIKKLPELVSELKNLKSRIESLEKSFNNLNNVNTKNETKSKI